MPEKKILDQKLPSVVGTGDAVGVPRPDENDPEIRKWLIARVLPNTEKSSRDKLQQLGYEVFLASQKEIRYWKNGNRVKKKEVERVVITQYLFLHVNQKERQEVIALPYIRAFLKDSAAADRLEFATISDTEMQILRFMHSQNEEAVKFLSQGFRVGEEVDVHLGSFEYNAFIVRLPNERSTYVGVHVNQLGCAYIRIPMQSVSHKHTKDGC